MKENMDYLHDFSLSQPQVLKMESCYERAQDVAKELADENIAKQKEIEESEVKNEELQKEFDEKQEELRSLFEQY